MPLSCHRAPRCYRWMNLCSKKFLLLIFINQRHLLLVFLLQLRFVRSNERANVGGQFQQLQPLFFVQGHGKPPMPIDRDRSLFAYLHALCRMKPPF